MSDIDPEYMEQSVTITDELMALASRMHTPEGFVNPSALHQFSSIIAGLPGDYVTADDATTLQALAVSLGYALFECAGNPDKVRTIANHLILVVESAGTFMELASGVTLNERRFFDNARPPPLQ
ncbi:hypothetical protein IFT84_13085 [Rhizobium sp. CFBP 8762]|uniref:hypothetical protein n=1 Tax=Rhizobium sp. CFBP 8762 TaxID=2775279 RepID=UPI00177E9D88|nr:hypothetical protein [Rhizobium sp. CFBP 8762]MBD8555439.1 hypothetical protein [Rhizobium sp. CFBP 8762]